MTYSSLLFVLAAAATSSSATAFVSNNNPSSSSSSRATTTTTTTIAVPSPCTASFAPNASCTRTNNNVRLNMAGDDATNTTDEKQKMAKMVTGEELEGMLQLWDQPLVVDAYATWCGPCLLMAPEFEEAAKELEGKVRFVKLDTDLEPQMAGRLGIMGLPTLLFLDKNDDIEAVEEGKAPVAVLKERIEGALRKESIVDVCNYRFFDGPMPTQLS